MSSFGRGARRSLRGSAQVTNKMVKDIRKLRRSATVPEIMRKTGLSKASATGRSAVNSGLGQVRPRSLNLTPPKPGSALGFAHSPHEEVPSLDDGWNAGIALRYVGRQWRHVGVKFRIPLFYKSYGALFRAVRIHRNTDRAINDEFHTQEVGKTSLYRRSQRDLKRLPGTTVICATTVFCP